MLYFKIIDFSILKLKVFIFNKFNNSFRYAQKFYMDATLFLIVELFAKLLTSCYDIVKSSTVLGIERCHHFQTS